MAVVAPQDILDNLPDEQLPPGLESDATARHQGLPGALYRLRAAVHHLAASPDALNDRVRSVAPVIARIDLSSLPHEARIDDLLQRVRRINQYPDAVATWVDLAGHITTALSEVTDHWAHRLHAG